MSTPSRKQLRPEDTWDLQPLYADLESWQKELAQVEGQIPTIGEFAGTLGQSVERLVETVSFYLQMSRALERLYVYAHLRSDEDTSSSENLGLLEQATNIYTRAASNWSFLTPEILALPQDILDAYLSHPQTTPYLRMLREIVRYKPHTLSKAEEALLAAGSEVFGASERIFSQLNNADLNFGNLEVDGQTLPLTHGSYIVFLKNQRREVREKAFLQYYCVYEAHKHTSATSLSASVKRDVYLARAKKHPTARERALFSDNVSTDVYDNLIAAVSKNLAPLHKYYELRKRVLKLGEQRIFDTYVPLVSDVNVDLPYDRAAELVLESLRPLGDEYVGVLRRGLLEQRWVDKYENKGKRSGAYSSGCFDSPPYILMNYKSDNFHDMFTLAHEAGHSMHSYFSSKHQPYQDHGYTIFVAEVASTFNEQLLNGHLKQVYANDRSMLAYLINQQIDDIKGTLYRQTMFAEFERTIHEIVEHNSPLTLDILRGEYKKLLKKYFGLAVVISELDELECLRIPHFYSAFYVYKYATGISAAVALSQAVLRGREEERQRYLGFLKGGCSKYPLELLKDAGVDMTKPQPIEAALALFAGLVDELEKVV